MSAKKDTPLPQDLSALEDSYRIVGELSARDHVRGYLANRIDDGADVQVLVEDAPDGDAGNALTHFAADANVLTTLEHRNLIPIRDGRWVGQQSFALVTDRCAAPTIATLIAKGESWSYPRIATILHELSGLLEWARRQKVVHRTVTLDTLHLEPDTDRVLASFVAQPLSRQGPPGAEGDARSIAALAWALITRGRDLPESPEQSIGIVRPELPRRVVEATDALLHGQRVGETDPPSVPDYIALVAMTDALMEGEVDAAELQAVIHQEQVLDREAWAAREAEYNARLAEQERQIQSEREDLERTLIAEREDLTATLAAERQQMAEERTELERQLEADRQQMADEHAELQRQLAATRAELEAQVAAERAQLAEERAELERQITAEREQMAASLNDGERALAESRTEFEVAVRTQRAEFEALLAAEREEFDRTIIAERNALEAEKEGLAVFHAAERAQIDAERRALDELLLKYEAGSSLAGAVEGRSTDAADASAHLARGEARPGDRLARRVPALLADMSTLAVATPVSEALADAVEPAETESGLTRKDAKRSRIASWVFPAALLMFVALLTAAALGLGGAEEDAGGVGRPGEARPAIGASQRASTRAPALVDSAAGAIYPVDSAPQARPDGDQSPPSGGAGRREERRSTEPAGRRPAPQEAASAVTPTRAVDSAMQAGRDTTLRIVPNPLLPVPVTADTAAPRDTLPRLD